MIRKLGSSLLAKASPGSQTRKKEEKKITKPVIPGKGVPGTPKRELVREPFIQQPAPGSEKIVRVAPGTESISTPSAPIGQTPLMAGAMGRGAAPGGARPGADGQALFQGEGAPSPAPAAAAPAPAGGRAPMASGMTGGAGRPIAPVQAARDTAMAAKAAASPQREGFLPTAMSFLSGRASADQPGAPVTTQPGMGATGVDVQPSTGQVTSFTPTAGQLLVGGLGKYIPGQVGKKMQTWGGAAQPAAQGIGSISNILRSLAQNFSQAPSRIRSSYESAFSKLRSLFR